MPKKETDLAARILNKTLELLQEKEPEEISTRDIAASCGVTATSLYYYYKDKETLFSELKLHCLEEMDKAILERMARKLKKNRTKSKERWVLELRAGLEAFRDWAFENPRIALLVMGRFKADTQAGLQKMEKYYRTTLFAKQILDKAVQAGLSGSKDTLLDVSLCIAALWGAIEQVLLFRTVPSYWSKQGGLFFTDKMIDWVLLKLQSYRNGFY